MKQKKQDSGDDGEEKPSSTRGRGRGPGGRGGKGRGRGRGKKNEGVDASQPVKARASSSKTDTHIDEDNEAVDKKPKTRNGKAKQDEGWAAWGTDDAWAQGWGDDGWDYNAWAWDSAAYWDAQASKHELGDPSAQEQASKSKATKSPKTLPNTNDEKNAHKEPKAEEKSKSKKRATKEVEAKKESESRKQARTSKFKGGDAADDNKPRKKRFRAAALAEDGPASTAHETRKSKAAAAPAEPTGETSTNTVWSDALPHSEKKRLEEIVSFMDGFKGMKEDHAYVLMRGRLQGTKACRLNVYGKRATPAVGLHCRKENKDFGYISISNSECPKHIQLAAASKAAEMLVTCMCTVVVLFHVRFNSWGLKIVDIKKCQLYTLNFEHVNYHCQYILKVGSKQKFWRTSLRTQLFNPPLLWGTICGWSQHSRGDITRWEYHREPCRAWDAWGTQDLGFECCRCFFD